MNGVQADFREASAQRRVRAVPLSHVSVELGHLYMEDLEAGPARLRALFAEAAPWARAAGEAVAVAKGRPRVSTCFLVDDYFSDLRGPDDVVPELLDAAQAAGLSVDYLARESSCARLHGPAGTVSPAELVVSCLVPEPAPGTNGGRPPAIESGWLSNGQRSPSTTGTAAMEVPPEWAPPVQNAARRHSIFVDVELWDDNGNQRTWSCPLLAATWQLLRLGLLRYRGEPVVEPADPPATWPSTWAELPAVMRLNPRAAPFAAYTTTSILSPRFLPVEVAVRTILGQVRHDPAVVEQLTTRATAEGTPMPVEVLDRIRYAFAGTGEVDPA